SDIRRQVFRWDVAKVAVRARQAKGIGGKAVLQQERGRGLITGEGGAADKWRIIRQPGCDTDVLVASVEDAEAATDHGLVRDLVSQPYARRKVVPVRACERTAEAAAARIESRNELQIAGAPLKNKVRLLIVRFRPGRRVFKSHPHVERQPGAYLPVVLHIGLINILPDGVELLLRRVGVLYVTEHEIGKSHA